MSLRIALITDLHFGPVAHFNGQLRKLSHTAEPLVQAFVERMNGAVHPDVVVNLGDVIEDDNEQADARNYARFLSALAPLHAPVIHVAGNHDTINLSPEFLAAQWVRPLPLHHSQDVGGFHLVVLRTIEEPGTRVDLPAEQLQFLEQDLANTEHPTVVLMHHPLSEMALTGNRWFENAPHIARVANRRAVRRILEDSGKVIAVFNGHCHWNHFASISGIPYFTLQSMTENVDDDAPGRPAATWTLAEFEEHSVRVDVFGEQPAHYQVELGRGGA